jgi:hypothetical protein
MAVCSAEPVRWKGRPAYRIANDCVELTVVLGGGHIVDLRLHGSPVNAMWEAPWQTIDPQNFSSEAHARTYGRGPVGRFLSGYSGHALALGYFGMPSAEQEARGLPLHSEAACSEWHVEAATADADSAELVMKCELPIFGLEVRRKIIVQQNAFNFSVHERVRNCRDQQCELQWVQHAAMGEPLFAPGEASLYLNATRGISWPLGYEGHELLPNSAELVWPYAQSKEGRTLDLAEPFPETGTGFVAGFLVDPSAKNGFVAVHNRQLGMVAGYVFERERFPWIALWEENCAREYPPWNGNTRVRGIEFGTSPMPMGLEHAVSTRTLFDTPVLTGVGGNAQIETSYGIFLSPAPQEWTRIAEVSASADSLVITGNNGEALRLAY